ncbi:lanthionine synthetase LanC family protein [Nocardioides lijunqiniae]|uniref:lanthionine synthetase LanC family protein n=1 Tax=Nocardioides lijunqiniae TaxID=2760832 RepID=UPI001877731B
MGDATYAEVGAEAWRWVLGRVRWDDGPWVPTSDPWPDDAGPPDDRDGLHSGIGGLALALAEVARTRPWTGEEERLATGVADRLRGMIPGSQDATWFDGLPGDACALLALGTHGADAAFARLRDLATPDGWAQEVTAPPKFLPGARINDVTLGTAGVLLAAVTGLEHDVSGAREVAEHAVEVLLAEAEPAQGGLRWRHVPERFRTTPATEMPNWSHGTAGVAAVLARAGVALERVDLVEAGAAGAEHLVTLAVPSGDGVVLPRYAPDPLPGEEPWSFGWCHGAAGTSQLFAALDAAGVASVGGAPPSAWRRRLLASVVSSGVPDRVRPGFWDNDGRCCGTAGVGEVVLDAWEDDGDERDLAFARRLGDALVERAVRDDEGARWRFVAPAEKDPLLPPGVGWMQGAAGIAAYLTRLGRVSPP